MVKEGRALRPESRGRVLSSFLHAFFPQYVDYGFTASLEDQLDEVSGLPVSGLPWLAWKGMNTVRRALPLRSRQEVVMQLELKHLIDQRHTSMLWPALQL